MVTHLLDTDICIYWLRGNPQVKQKLSDVTLGSLSICSITLAELYVGAYSSKTPADHLAQIVAFIHPFMLFTIDDDVLHRFGQLKTFLRRENRLIGDFDILIASVAITQGLVLVTNNIQHYARIPDIRIENWVAPSTSH
jgi:tRNA(fMet)-specific endonuclease VapC